jgi:hypothetical protein
MASSLVWPCLDNPTVQGGRRVFKDGYGRPHAVQCLLMARASLSSATFRCEDSVVTAAYIGRRLWELSGPVSNWSGPHDQVATAIRDALRLEGEMPYNTKVVEVVAQQVTGTIKNNTFPTDLWFVDLNGGRWTWAAAEKGLDAAIMACLVALKLTPVRQPSIPVNALKRDQFGRSALVRAKDRGAWAQDLGCVLSMRLRSVVDAESEVPKIVQELKALGHDLWSDEESDDFAIWTYNYMKPPPGPRLSIHFSYSAYEEPAVEVTVQDAP